MSIDQFPQNSATQRGRRRTALRLLATLAVMCLGAATLTAGVYAAFTDTESGGTQNITTGIVHVTLATPTGDHGSLSTYDPLGNAKAAVIISDDGTNWTPWTTYTSGAYLGRC